MSSTRNANVTSHLCGAGFAFFGFAITLIIGLVVGNDFITIVLRGLGVLVLFYILGLTLSAVGHKAVEENFQTQADAVREKENAMAEVVAAEETNRNTQDQRENPAGAAEALVQTEQLPVSPATV